MTQSTFPPKPAAQISVLFSFARLGHAFKYISMQPPYAALSGTDLSNPNPSIQHLYTMTVQVQEYFHVKD